MRVDGWGSQALTLLSALDLRGLAHYSPEKPILKPRKQAVKCLAKVAQLTRRLTPYFPSLCSTALGGRDTSQLVISNSAPSLDLCCVGFGFCCFFQVLGAFFEMGTCLRLLVAGGCIQYLQRWLLAAGYSALAKFWALLTIFPLNAQTALWLRECHHVLSIARRSAGAASERVCLADCAAAEWQLGWSCLSAARSGRQWGLLPRCPVPSLLVPSHALLSPWD